MYIGGDFRSILMRALCALAVLAIPGYANAAERPVIADRPAEVSAAEPDVPTFLASADQRNIARRDTSVFDRITRAPVTFTNAGFTLEDVRPQLEATLGVPLTLTSGASTIPYRGQISADDGLSFIEELSAKLNLEWAIGRDSVFLSPAGTSRTANFDAPSVEAGYLAVDLARQNFEGMGSNIRVALRDDQISISGIPAWIEQVAERVTPEMLEIAMDNTVVPEPATSEPWTVVPRVGSSTRDDDESMALMVFRLNNAYVDDKKISVGSNTVIFPGVAKLFLQFTGIAGDAGSTAEPVRSSQNTQRVQRMDPLAGERRPYWPELAYEEPQPVSSEPVVPVSPNGPAVIADPRTNSLIVRDKPSMRQSYTELIKLLDRPVEMVQLDAFVIDIKASRFNEFGLALSWSDASWNSPNFAPGGNIPSSPNLILQATQGAQLLTRIRALESEGESEMLTVPSVVTQNNLEASFSARESFYVKVSGNLDASLTEVTVETLLSVTPLVEQASDSNPAVVNDDRLGRRIRLLINIQDGSVDSTVSNVVDELPRTLENQITTQAVVRGGETLVIGGQMVRKEASEESGLPGIRRIPLLGKLTSSRAKRFEEYVRVYVVRPKILLDNPVATMAPANPAPAPAAFDSSAPDATAPVPEPLPTEPPAPPSTQPAPIEAPPAYDQQPLSGLPDSAAPPNPMSVPDTDTARSDSAPPAAPSEPDSQTDLDAWFDSVTAPIQPDDTKLYGPVRDGETLWSIASRLAPPGISVQRMLIALQRNNHEAFSNDNVALLRAGSQLQVPDLDQISSISQEEALAALDLP